MPTYHLTQPSASAETEPLGVLQYEKRGVVAPLRRDAKGDFANESGVLLILANAEQILGTRCSDARHAGEIPWDPELGSLLHLLRHQNIRPVQEHLAYTYVVDALARWEPRLRVRRVQLSSKDRAMTVRVLCDVFDRAGRGRLLARDQTLEVNIVRAA